MDGNWTIIDLPPRKHTSRRSRLRRRIRTHDSLPSEEAHSSIHSIANSKPTLSSQSVGGYKAKRNFIAVMPPNYTSKAIRQYKNSQSDDISDKPHKIDLCPKANYIHILIIYKNTSVCLKFTDDTMIQSNDENQSQQSNLPIIINMNLQKLACSLKYAPVSIPNELMIVIFQYLMPQKEIRFNNYLDYGQYKLTIFDNINNYGKILGTYCLNGKHGHQLIKKYQDIVEKVSEICADYAELNKLDKYMIFDNYIHSRLSSSNHSVSSSSVYLCRDHYCMNKV